MDSLTVIIPYWQGHSTIHRLLDSLPEGLPVLIVDDLSDKPLYLERPNTRVIRLDERGYFSGAVNAGITTCETDALILNQDAELQGTEWLDLILNKREEFALIGDGVMDHPAWPRGYIQGTFMFIRRNAWEGVGLFNEHDYCLWGATCEWQLRACRRGYKALPLSQIPGLKHAEDRVEFVDTSGRTHRQKFGSAITEALRREPAKRDRFIRTPPMISVIVPCYNYGHYLPDAISSLIGGPTSLGDAPGQTFQSFEAIIVDDASTDDSWQVAESLADRWRGIRAHRLPKNVGTAAAINYGIKRAFGKYITVLSADDMREPYSLKTQLRACQASPHKVVYGNPRTFKRGQRDKVLPVHKYDFDLLLTKNMMPAGIMYPKGAWTQAGGYPEEMRDGREDWAFNIALGICGWCGLHIGDDGYLYRREGHNRSLKNSNRGRGRGHYYQQIKAIFPNIYAGDRPMACCGQKAVAIASRRPSRRPVAAPPAAAEMVLLAYVGGNLGNTTWWGPVTNTRYIFGKSRPTGYVFGTDVEGLLAAREGKQAVFRRADG